MPHNYADMFQWNERFETGNAFIDEQHKHFINLAKQVGDMYARPINKDELQEALDGLIAYIKKHFKDEEKLMRSVNYPKLKEQHEQHKEIIRNINDILHKAKTTNQLKESLYTIVRTWFLRHVMQEDTEIGKFMKENNIEQPF